MDIYSILSSVPHNNHYLNRYYKFILYCKDINVNLDKTIYTEKHHICPKAKSLFPQYANFKENPWNLIVLTARQHYIAHMILWKTYGGSMTYAFKRFLDKCSSNKSQYIKITSKQYENLKNNFSKLQSIRMTYRLKTDKKLITNISNAIKKRNAENNPSKSIENRKASAERLSQRLKNPLTNPNNNPINLERAKIRKQQWWDDRKHIFYHCPHCSVKSRSKGIMHRYHFDKCKFMVSRDQRQEF